MALFPAWPVGVSFRSLKGEGSSVTSHTVSPASNGVRDAGARGGHMSEEAHELMGDVWTRWQGHLINGVFPLGRYLGCSDHSGVFLTRSAARSPSDVAVKLVPADRAIAESLLPRWKRAGSLAQPHLLRLLEWGGCQLDGLPYLYTVMEYADQTLAQLLRHRALTEEEAREMLPPILDALAFLHGHDLIQGRMKPANILVVGDQLKLASDTVRRVSESAPASNARSLYDPPEALDGDSSPAGDIWALGVSLFEALTRRPPSGFGKRSDPVELPADFPAAFRELVVRCLSPRPQDRPSVTELMAWTQTRSLGSAAGPTVQPPALVQPDQSILVPVPVPVPVSVPVPAQARTAPPHVAPEVAAQPASAVTRPLSTTAEPASAMAQPASAAAQPPKRHRLLAGMLAAAILALGWMGMRAFRAHPRPTAPASPASPVSAASSASRAFSARVAGGSTAPMTNASGPATAHVPDGNDAATSSSASSPSSALHEVIPRVPLSARRTIHGHIKVWVRVIVNQDGSVFAALVDRAGPSRYFRRLALEAAKNWTFPAVDAPARRLMQVRFDFSREGTTGAAVTLH